jgi:hypothetical protein
MDTKFWEQEVRLELRPAKFETIKNTDEALKFLVERWPVRGGDLHQEARKICLSVLAGKSPAENARAAFIRAAQEANIFVKF